VYIRRFFSMKKCYTLFFITFIIFLNFSCKREITPAYLLLCEDDFKDCIHVANFNSVHETTYDDEELEAIKQQNFRDVLVSLNGKELGYWQLPCKIPLLPNYSDKNYVRILPCARVPYTSLTAVPYYFLSIKLRCRTYRKNLIPRNFLFRRLHIFCHSRLFRLKQKKIVLF